MHHEQRDDPIHSKRAILTRNEMPPKPFEPYEGHDAKATATANNKHTAWPSVELPQEQVKSQKREVIVLVGTRPEAIKMAPIVKELQGSRHLAPFLLSSGQHRELLEQALAPFGLMPDMDLGLMQPNQSLPDLTSRAISAIHNVLLERKPAALLVQGDTTTVLAGAMAATYANIPVGHVEAGLRTYDLQAPFPEEMNRRLTTPLCRWLFAPTATTQQNLLRENIAEHSIFITGNTVVDSLFWMRDQILSSSKTSASRFKEIGLPERFSSFYGPVSSSPSPQSGLVLITGHRRENFGDGMKNICSAISQLAAFHPRIPFIYPVHLNPNVQVPVMRELKGLDNVFLIPPVDYESFVFLMMNSSIILSDSGGVQEEAPSLGKPVLVMREKTERPEGVEAGTCVLVGTSPDAIVLEANRLLSDAVEYKRRSSIRNPYGDGWASARIREILEASLRVP